MGQLANLTTTLALESSAFVAGIEQSRGAVRKLVASLDPAAAAQAKFNRQMDLAERGLKSGQLSADLYAKVVERLKQRLDEATRNATRLTQTNGMMRAGFQQLGFQLGDISQGFAMGTSAATIFAQQSGQVIQSLQLMSAETQGVLAFLGGPWGAVLSAALVAATPFVAKIFEGNNALEEQVDKLKKNAEASAVADRAKVIFGKTLPGVTQAIREQKQALDGMADSDRTAAQAALANAKAQAQKTADILRATAAALRQAAAESSAAHQVNFGAAGGAGAAGAQRLFDTKVADLLKRSRDAQAAAEAAQRLITQANYTVAVETAKRMADPIQTVTKKYDDQVAAIEKVDLALIAAGKHARADSAARITALEKEKQARIDAIQSAASEASKARRKRQQESREAAREAAKEAKATADLIADASTGAYKALIGLQKEQGKTIISLFGDDADQWDKFLKNAETAFTATQGEQIDNERDLQRIREGHIRDLAGLFSDLFTGGTKRLWQDFERWGFDVLAKLAAQWTMAALFPTPGQNKGGFFSNLFSAIGQTFGGGNLAAPGGTFSIPGIGDSIPYIVPGFAGGGSFQFGGRDGIDKNILSLNGSPIARVSKGETAHIRHGAASNDNPVIVQLVVGEGQMFEPRVAAISGAVSVQTVSAAQKAQAKQAGRRLGR